MSALVLTPPPPACLSLSLSLSKVTQYDVGSLSKVTSKHKILITHSNRFKVDTLQIIVVARNIYLRVVTVHQ